MTTIDLTSRAAAAAAGPFGELPRRVGLTLPELQLLAEFAGGAPLPFDLADVPATNPLEGRLGDSPQGGDRAAHERAVAALHDPRESLQRRGLLVDDTPDAGAVGAIGLLAAPELALDIEVAVASGQARAWHRQRAGAVAMLGTVDGIVFELAWCAARHWADELARVAVLPEDLTLTDSQVPTHLVMPYSVADAVGEAMATGRGDVVTTLTSGDAQLAGAATALHTEARGRLRVLAARVADETTRIGVVSWLLVGDGWRALRPHGAGDDLQVEVRSVEPADLAAELAPVLTEVRA
ncbi:hypothetical protein [Nocardioides limicola]|uniref:hypothetical protein n=1 Tax=Nocardioides limicola TaxID=2803368 RepID=UPI00193B3120|nr:hypothetical protein [Nocardioides sp. DJM-14]